MTGRRNTTEEIKKMQEEAIKRVKEMHARSKPTNIPPMQQAPSRSTREKTPKTQNTEKTDTMAKKRNVSEKPQHHQNKNHKFTARNTRFIKNLFPPANQNLTPGSKKFKPENIMDKLPNFLDLILKDGDKSLLIVLIILLMDDEENFMILLVLFYLLV